ncbi:MAG: LysM peptidoglycan-binding domain-containing protein [Elusimicrobia bacterium]|nr:LysM peptidoglycan-binding domain-containing protein [Elusimicrobiota bacterium]
MRRFVVIVALILGWAGLTQAGPVLRRSGLVTDGRGAPLTGTFLLDFRLAPGTGPGWGESIYVSAVDGIFHAELGKVRPLPQSQGLTGDMVEVSAPAGSGWVVRPMLAVPDRTRRPAPAPAARPAAAPAREPAGPAASSSEVLQLQKELQRTRAELEAQKSAVRPSVYVVQPGDTLRSIAEKVFGNAEQWVDLYQANEDRVLRGGDLVPGQKLIIPRDVTGAERRD